MKEQKLGYENNNTSATIDTSVAYMQDWKQLKNL